MKVLVTGASGFVGSHTVKALVEAGHQVRAAARSAHRIRRALRPHGCADAVETVEVDLTSREPVVRALTGCDAVVHTAAVHSFDARRRPELHAINVRSTDLVLGSAYGLGLNPIVHVSSFTALLPAAQSLTASSPVGDPPVPCGRSKALAEWIARRWQLAGAPVTIVTPEMVWGPHDPACGESTLLARSVLQGRLPFRLPGVVPVVDVRDLAAVHVAVLSAGVAPRRYLAVAETPAMAEIQRLVAAAGGGSPARLAVPAPVLSAAGRLADLLQRMLPVRLTFGREGTWTALHCPPGADASATTADLGVTFRSAAESVLDTVRWLIGSTEQGPLREEAA